MNFCQKNFIVYVQYNNKKLSVFIDCRCKLNARFLISCFNSNLKILKIRGYYKTLNVPVLKVF